MTRFISEDVARSAQDPVIAAALAARARLDAGFAAQDVDAVAALSAKNLIVNTPANLIARLDVVLAFFKAGRMDYEAVDVTVEGVDNRGDHVVLMGEEVVRPKAGGTNPHAGKIVRRRFTDVWYKETDGAWRLGIRHATITAVE